MRNSTRELRDAQVRGFLDSLQQPGLAGPRLADPTPPREPPAPVLLAKPIAHQLVRWHRLYSRVTKIEYETKEAAKAAALLLDPVVFYKFAIMRGREMVESRDLETPEFSFWNPVQQ